MSYRPSSSSSSSSSSSHHPSSSSSAAPPPLPPPPPMPQAPWPPQIPSSSSSSSSSSKSSSSSNSSQQAAASKSSQANGSTSTSTLSTASSSGGTPVRSKGTFLPFPPVLSPQFLGGGKSAPSTPPPPLPPTTPAPAASLATTHLPPPPLPPAGQQPLAPSSPISPPSSSQRNGQQPAMLPQPIIPPKMMAEPFLGMNNSLALYEDFVQVGEGTYGVVFKAKNRETGQMVALKCIKMDNEKEGFPITAMREIKVLQRIHHKNVVGLHEIITNKDLVYLVIEYMEHDLTGLLSQPEADFPENVIKSYMKQLLEGLAYLHSKSIIHRDIKASNLLINNRGELKLADFGLARTFSINPESKVYTNRIITLRYRAPELLLGAVNYGPEVDMWSVGCIMVELFIKKPLFRGDDEVNQISLIFKKCGSPTRENWPDAEKLAWYKFLKPRHTQARVIIEDLADYLSPCALDLVDKMLTLDPARRISAHDALKHPYFTEEYPPPCDVNEMPKFQTDHREYEAKRLKRSRQGDTSESKRARYDLS